MTSSDQKPNQAKDSISKPFPQGNKIIKNLITTPDTNNNDRESLLDQIVDNPQLDKPVPDSGEGKNDSK